MGVHDWYVHRGALETGRVIGEAMLEFLRDVAVIVVGIIIGLPITLYLIDRMADWWNL